MAALPWREREGGIDLRVRVTPRASRDAIEGVAALSDANAVLKVRVRAVPAEGAANRAVIGMLAKALSVPASRMTVSAGASGRTKTVFIEGDAATLAAALADIAEGD